jgi:hypothetical protein
VRFIVSGANSVTGSAVTNASGQAVFAYRAAHAGTDNIAAWVDTNNNGVREANEPRQFTTAHIGSVAKRAEHPTLSLATHRVNGIVGRVSLRVRTHPRVAALVIYYEKIKGRWERIGSAHTGHLGRAGRTFQVPVGRHSFRAHVTHTSTTRPGTTPVKSIRVR